MSSYTLEMKYCKCFGSLTLHHNDLTLSRGGLPFSDTPWPLPPKVWPNYSSKLWKPGMCSCAGLEVWHLKNETICPALTGIKISHNKYSWEMCRVDQEQLLPVEQAYPYVPEPTHTKSNRFLSLLLLCPQEALKTPCKCVFSSCYLQQHSMSATIHSEAWQITC